LFPSDLVGEGHHLTVGRQVQLLLDQGLVHPGVLQRSVPVAGGNQAFHQAERDPRVERILCRELAPPAYRGRVIGLAGRVPGQPLEYVGVLSRISSSLFFRPPLELG
jgi:hypothetical protein